MQVKVSIIIPAYNAKPTLSKCLDSCINQTFEDIEIIIINDGSTDGSNIIMCNYAKIDGRINVINKINEGLPFARKSGVEVAKGEYVFHLDADDCLPLNALQSLYKVAKNENADLVAGNVLIIKNQITEERLYSKFGSGYGTEFLDYILNQKLHYVWGKLIKRTLYSNNKITYIKEASIGEDQIQMYQLCMFANKVATTNEIVIHYIINTTSLTQRKTKSETFTKNWEIYAISINDLTKRFPYSTYAKQQMKLRILWALFGAIGTSKEFIHDKKKSSKILYSTIFKSIFSKHSLIFKHYKLLGKALAYPIVYKLMRRSN